MGDSNVYIEGGRADHVYADKERCCEDLCLARELFGNRSTTESQYKKMQFSLGLILLYCPEEMKSLAEATIIEAGMRELYFHMNVWNCSKPTEDRKYLEV